MTVRILTGDCRDVMRTLAEAIAAAIVFQSIAPDCLETAQRRVPPVAQGRGRG